MSGGQTVVHRNLTVLQVSDPRVLDEIRAVVPLDEFVIGRVDETTLVVDPARVGELSRRLAEREMTPLVKKARV